MDYKRIDLDEEAVYSGYSFVDSDGVEFAVDDSDYDCVGFYTDGCEQFAMYKKDIPMMIKALKEAHSQWLKDQ